MTISIHGLGFIQVPLDGDYRLHIWDKDLPRRKNIEHSEVHNHRFGFISRVLKGSITNHSYNVNCPGQFIKYNHPTGTRGEHGNRPWVEQSGTYAPIPSSPPQTYLPGERYRVFPYESPKTERRFALTLLC